MATPLRDIFGLFGMVVWSTAHRLAGPHPEADTYEEIVESKQFPGGEAGNAALLLAAWGCKTRLYGPWWGSETAVPLKGWFDRAGVDTSGMVADLTYRGVQDLILVGNDQTRTVLGRFGEYFRDETRRWSVPSDEMLARSTMVCIDPFFPGSSEEVAQACVRLGTPFVSIDCDSKTMLARGSAGLVLSSEYLRNRHPGRRAEEVLADYTSVCKGLVIVTQGARAVLFSRGGEVVRMTPPKVDVVSTLGAGDSFRAGIAYALAQGWEDSAAVAFAMTTAAACCQRFPIAENPPSLAEIAKLDSRNIWPHP